jgi:hypothetical protein
MQRGKPDSALNPQSETHIKIQVQRHFTKECLKAKKCSTIMLLILPVKEGSTTASNITAGKKRQGTMKVSPTRCGVNFCKKSGH